MWFLRNITNKKRQWSGLLLQSSNKSWVYQSELNCERNIVMKSRGNYHFRDWYVHYFHKPDNVCCEDGIDCESQRTAWIRSQKIQNSAIPITLSVCEKKKYETITLFSLLSFHSVSIVHWIVRASSLLIFVHIDDFYSNKQTIYDRRELRKLWCLLNRRTQFLWFIHLHLNILLVVCVFVCVIRIPVLVWTIFCKMMLMNEIIAGTIRSKKI